jgi:mercuric ion transport protein
MKRGVVMGSAVGALGAAGAAFLGVLCCAGPLVVAVIGTGGAVAAARLQPYRPYLLGASCVLLGIGFWRSYRRDRACAADSGCKVRSSRPTRIVLWIAAVATLASALAPRFLT